MKKAIATINIILLTVFIAFSQDNIELRYTNPEMEWVRDLAVYEDYLFLAQGRNFDIYSIADPASPVKINTVNSRLSGVSTFTIHENYLIVYAIESGPTPAGGYTVRYIQIYNLADPTNPSLLSEFTTSSMSYGEDGFSYGGDLIYDQAIYDGYLYMAGEYNDLIIHDINSPENPVHVNDILVSFDGSRSIAIKDNFLFLNTGESGIKIFNIYSPEYPLEIGTFSDITDISSLIIHDNFLYACADNEIFTIDVSNPTNPNIIDRTNCADSINEIRQFDGMLYILAGEKSSENEPELYIYEIQSTGSLVESAHLTNFYHPLDVDFKDEHGYLADEEGCLKILDIVPPLSPTIETVFGFTGQFVSGLIENRTGYYSLNNYRDSSFYAIDLYDFNINPVQGLSNVESSFSVNNKICMISDQGDDLLVQIGSISEGMSFIQESFISLERAGDLRKSSLYNDTLYVLDFNYPSCNIKAIDLTDISNPAIVNNWAFTNNPHNFFVSDEYIITYSEGGWAGSLDSLRYYERSDLSVQVYSSYTTGAAGVKDIEIVGEYAYIARSHSLGIDIIHFNSETPPHTVRNYTEGNCEYLEVTYQDSLLYTLTNNRGIRIYNIDDPANPELVASHELDLDWIYTPKRMAIDQGRILVSDENGINLLKVSENLVTPPDDPDAPEDPIPTTFRVGSVYPNPMNPRNPISNIRIDISVSGNLNVTVYNVLGQNVATIANQAYDAGTYILPFDGSELASGIYFVKASMPGQVNHIQKVVLMK